MPEKNKKVFWKNPLFIGIISTILVISIILTIVVSWAIHSDAVTLTFQIKETGEKLDGSLYQNNLKIGDVKEGKIKIAGGTIYPGEIEFILDEPRHSFYFELSISDVQNKEGNFHIEQYQIEDLGKSISDYNLELENKKIIEEINKERLKQGNNALKEDYRLNEIASEIAKEVVNGKIDKEDISLEMITDKIMAREIFFSYREKYWFEQQLDSRIILSEEFIKEMQKSKSWSDFFFSKSITNIGISTECYSDKTCFTLVVVSKNELNYNDSLRNNYLREYDIYYLANLENVNYSSPVKILFNSDKHAKIYIANSTRDYDKILKGKSYNKIFETTVSSLEKEITLNPENIIVLHADYGNMDYTLEIAENKI